MSNRDVSKAIDSAVEMEDVVCGDEISLALRQKLISCQDYFETADSPA